MNGSLIILFVLVIVLIFVILLKQIIGELEDIKENIQKILKNKNDD